MVRVVVPLLVPLRLRASASKSAESASTLPALLLSCPVAYRPAGHVSFWPRALAPTPASLYNFAAAATQLYNFSNSPPPNSVFSFVLTEFLPRQTPDQKGRFPLRTAAPATRRPRQRVEGLTGSSPGYGYNNLSLRPGELQPEREVIPAVLAVVFFVLSAPIHDLLLQFTI